MRAVVSFLRRNPSIQSRSRPCLIGIASRSLHVTRILSLRHEPLHHVQRVLTTSQPRLYHTDTEEPTIYALSTASGRAAIAVIRVSGPACRQVRILHTITHLRPSHVIGIQRAVSLCSLPQAPACNPTQTIYPPSASFACNDTRLRRPYTLLSCAEYRNGRRRPRTARTRRPGRCTCSPVSYT
jgi:hypothetical protein